jgi:hypothetical protein
LKRRFFGQCSFVHHVVFLEDMAKKSAEKGLTFALHRLKLWSKVG